jgi:hypothetical protein
MDGCRCVEGSVELILSGVMSVRFYESGDLRLAAFISLVCAYPVSVLGNMVELSPTLVFLGPDYGYLVRSSFLSGLVVPG